MKKSPTKNDKLPTTYNELSENENLHRMHDLSGERKLLLALLSRAFLDLSSENFSIRQDVLKWFYAPTEDNPEITSLQYICGLFSLSVKQVLTKVEQIMLTAPSPLLPKEREIVLEYLLHA